jgi:hypothetical protein
LSYRAEAEKLAQIRKTMLKQGIVFDGEKFIEADKATNKIDKAQALEKPSLKKTHY